MPEGSGKTEQCSAMATPVGLLVLLLVFDWRLGLLSLIPVFLAFAIMAAMAGKRMAEKMRQYPQRKALVEAQRAHMEAEIGRMERALDMLKFKCWYYDQAIRDGGEKGIPGMIPDGLPENIRLAYENTPFLSTSILPYLSNKWGAVHTDRGTLSAF